MKKLCFCVPALETAILKICRKIPVTEFTVKKFTVCRVNITNSSNLYC